MVNNAQTLSQSQKGFGLLTVILCLFLLSLISLFVYKIALNGEANLSYEYRSQQAFYLAVGAMEFVHNKVRQQFMLDPQAAEIEDLNYSAWSQEFNQLNGNGSNVVISGQQLDSNRVEVTVRCEISGSKKIIKAVFPVKKAVLDYGDWSNWKMERFRESEN